LFLKPWANIVRKKFLFGYKDIEDCYMKLRLGIPMRAVKRTFIAITLLASMGSCETARFGIVGDINPKEHVHVFLPKKLIITGYVRAGQTKLVDAINNEKKNYDFYIPAGPQEIFVKTAYTYQVYSFISQSSLVKINADKGDTVFLCADIKEISSRMPSGGNVDVVIFPTILYLKSDEEKNQAMIDNHLNAAYFEDRCNAAVYSKP